MNDCLRIYNLPGATDPDPDPDPGGALTVSVNGAALIDCCGVVIGSIEVVMGLMLNVACTGQ